MEKPESPLNQLQTEFILPSEKGTYMEVDINNATEKKGWDIIGSSHREIMNLLEVSLGEVHHNTTLLWQRDHWARTSMP